MDFVYDKLIDDIIHLPSEFKKSNISLFDLLQNSGYFENHNNIKEYDIAKALISNPECIQSWLLWSDDKRSYGWYFKECGNKKFLVGFYPENVNYPDITYENVFDACASFIKKEIDSISSD